MKSLKLIFRKLQTMVELYSMDRWYITPTIVHYNDVDWHGYNSIDLAWLKWGVAFVYKKRE
jgi:hypothetical protein